MTPSAAATLVLLRDGPDGGLETLLIQRHQNSKFAGGDFVFAGGKIEADDDPHDAVDWCAGLGDAEARRVLGLAHEPRTALGYWIGAIREAFEEVGVLVAYGPDGRPPSVGAPRFDAYREACQDDHRAFWGMVRAERLTLATDRLTYFAHWVTPEENPIRFDTRFFAAEMPPDQEARADGREIVAVRWLPPSRAVEAYRRGEISLKLPTLKNLALLADATSAADALARLARLEIRTMRPRLIIEGGTRRALLPGDPGYY